MIERWELQTFLARVRPCSRGPGWSWGLEYSYILRHDPRFDEIASDLSLGPQRDPVVVIHNQCRDGHVRVVAAMYLGLDDLLVLVLDREEVIGDLVTVLYDCVSSG